MLLAKTRFGKPFQTVGTLHIINNVYQQVVLRLEIKGHTNAVRTLQKHTNFAPRSGQLPLRQRGCFRAGKTGSFEPST